MTSRERGEPSGAEVEARDEALAVEVRRAFAEQLEVLRSLVEIESHTPEVREVSRAQSCFVDAFARLGFEVERHADPSGAHAEHVVLRHGPRDVGSTALVGHADTVFPHAMGFRGFRREGDRLLGPGVLDMKSGLTSIAFALRALAGVDRAAFDALAVTVISVSDEEVGSPSSRPLYRALAPSLAEALVFEAGRVGDAIVTRRKGSGNYELKARGVAAHAGNRHREGVNAIHALALAIAEAESLTDYARGLTVSVGLVRGGTAKNTVPDEAEADLDVRFERPEDVVSFEAALAAMGERALARAPTAWIRPALSRATIEATGRVNRPPMVPIEGTASLLADYATAARSVGLGGHEAPLQGGGSDANLLVDLGVPSIDGLGPFGEHFHETREWCSAESLERRTVALARFLAARARHPALTRRA